MGRIQNMPKSPCLPLDDWEKKWQEKPQRSVQPKLLEGGFQGQQVEQLN